MLIEISKKFHLYSINKTMKAKQAILNHRSQMNTYQKIKPMRKLLTI